VIPLTEESCPDPSGKRYKSLDVFKGLAIFGVIVTHLAILQGDTGEGGSSPFTELMYAGLPMFMLVSGMFYRPGRTYLENLRRRVLPFVILFAVAVVGMTLVAYAYMWAIGYDLAQYDVLEVIGNVLVSKGALIDWTSADYVAERAFKAPFEVTIQMYYLQILVGGYLIFFLIADHVLPSLKRTVTAVLALLTVTAVYFHFGHVQFPFNLQLSALVASFLLIGAYLARCGVPEFLENVKDRKFWIVFLCVVVAAVLSAVFLPTGTNMDFNDLGDFGFFSTYTFMITSLSCGAFILMLAAAFAKIPYVSRIFELMGKYILPLFVLHMFVGKILIAPFVEIGTDKWIPLSFTEGLVLALVTIVVISAGMFLYHMYVKPRIMSRIKKGE